MRLLVLGGAGYVGSHFVWHAQDHGHDVAVVDHLERGHAEYLPQDVNLDVFDIRDTEALKRTIARFKPDVILHYAAYALVPESVQNPQLYFDNNVGGVASLIAANTTASSSPVPIVFSSTCAVYGSPRELPIRESAELLPESPYGESKKQGEVLLAEAAERHKFPVMALRYFNACGADAKLRTGEAHEPETHLIPNVIKAILAGEACTLFGRDYPTPDGTCVRDYIHVTDLAAVHLAACHKLIGSTGFTALNLGTGIGLSNLSVIKAVEQATGLGATIDFADRRPGDPPQLYADPSLARQLLNFNPRHSDIETITASAVAWYQRGQSRD